MISRAVAPSLKEGGGGRVGARVGIQDRWQNRRDELVADSEAREAEAVGRHNDRVEAGDLVLVEEARRAFERGDGWFEAEIERRSAGSMTPGSFPMDLGMPPLAKTKIDHPGVPRSARSDLLSRIEDEGWSLHTAQYVYVQLGEESREKWFSSNQQVAIKGQIVGVYLFRRA